MGPRDESHHYPDPGAIPRRAADNRAEGGMLLRRAYAIRRDRGSPGAEEAEAMAAAGVLTLGLGRPVSVGDGKNVVRMT